MCGIFGVNINNRSKLSKNIDNLIKDLFILSESRGKEASGYCAVNDDNYIVQKVPFQSSKLIKTQEFKESMNMFKTSKLNYSTFFGHSRLVTNGYEQFSNNNQPVVLNQTVLVHNGIIINFEDLWNKNISYPKSSDLDTEVVAGLFEKNINEYDIPPFENLKSIFENLVGMTSIALLNGNYDNLFLATNNGSLYYLYDRESDAFVFASEKVFLNKIEKKYLENESLIEIHQLHAHSFLSLNLKNNSIEVLDSKDNRNFTNIDSRNDLNEIKIIKTTEQSKSNYVNNSLEHHNFIVKQNYIVHYDKSRASIDNLKRCSKCILPETFPFIEFDENCVCNYCNHYKKNELLGVEKFEILLKENIDANKSPNCLLPFSGGRDSSFVMHYIIKELNLKPIAFSYDWGMLTDLARRNQSRMCGKLGIEHILISADIRKKRDNIRKNVLAWLKRPSLGTIPLFMAGDKQYFFFSNQIMNQNNLKISILGENLLETTKFKSGFCGIKPKFDSDNTYSLSLNDKIKMSMFYGKEYLLNPYYLNSSVIDTLDAFKSYYMIKHEIVNLFSYLKWDEQQIESILINEYDWETDPETKTTWRIGDGTAAFYNYIYYIVAGFTENDTFRSNQIREGMLTREEALVKAIEENEPRWNSIKWYCDTINIDFESTLNNINNIPKLYER